MSQLTESDMDDILRKLNSHSLSPDQARRLQRAVNAGFQAFSFNQKRQFAVGDVVNINHDGNKYSGIIRKINPKNVRIELDDGRMVNAHPTLLSHQE